MLKPPDAPVQYFRYRSAAAPAKLPTDTALPGVRPQALRGNWEMVHSRIVQETPVSLTLNGQLWLTFMCTPTDLEALAVGFLYNEGWIQSAGEIASLNVCASGENIDVWLDHVLPLPNIWKRTSGCSGGMTAVADHLPLTVVEDAEQVSPEWILGLQGRLWEAQELYQLTGGVHTSILSDGENTAARAEDIGRHNTLDKIAGHYLLERLQLQRRILLTTGRISSEMMQKAARIRASILISRTSPNALSVHMAQEMGITLIGYARREQFNIYTHPERIEGAPEEVIELAVAQGDPG